MTFYCKIGWKWNSLKCLVLWRLGMPLNFYDIMKSMKHASIIKYSCVGKHIKPWLHLFTFALSNNHLKMVIFLYISPEICKYNHLARLVRLVKCALIGIGPKLVTLCNHIPSSFTNCLGNSNQTHLGSSLLSLTEFTLCTVCSLYTW